jgi:hypothetical protein
MHAKAKMQGLVTACVAIAVTLPSVAVAAGKKASFSPPAITYSVSCTAAEVTLRLTIVDDVEVAYYFAQLQGSNALPIFVMPDPGSQTVEAEYTVGFEQHIMFAAVDIEGNVAKTLITTPSCTP